MIAFAHFRRGGPTGREPIAAPGDVVSIAKDFTASQQYWGKVTSKRPARLSRAELEVVAFRLGCTVDAARRAIMAGLCDG